MTLKGEARTKYMRDYMRRRRAGQQAKPKPRAPASDGEGQLTRSRREEFAEVGRLKAEIGRLKSDIFKLKAMLQEEPDAAKLRKKVADQKMEMASMRRVMKEIAKERDLYQGRARSSKYKQAHRLLTRTSYGVIAKALHSDRLKGCTPAELAEAERLVVALRPLFDEEG